MNVDVTIGIDSEGTYSHGSVATYACKDGFVASGEATSTCLESGEWEPLSLVCDAGSVTRTHDFFLAHTFNFYINLHIIFILQYFES